MVVTTTSNGRGEERESLAISVAAAAGSNTKKARKRAPRACLNCRDLKIKCEKIDNATIYTRCKCENIQCVFVSSRRGGQNKHKHTGNTPNNQNNNTTTNNNNNENRNGNITRTEPENSKRPLEQPQGSPNEFDYIANSSSLLETGDITFKKPKNNGSDGGSVVSGDGDDTSVRRQSEDISQRTIQNPSDSLNLLAQAAFNNDSNESIEDKKKRK